MVERLAGKVALITGTGGGQGRAAARLFAREGARVVGCDLKAEGAGETVERVRSAGGDMVSLQPLDLRDEAQVARLIAFAVESYGDFDILYNSAASARGGFAETMTRDDWDWTLEADLTLMWLTIKHAIPVFRRRGSGAIVNIASVAGMHVAASHAMLAHSVAKAGIIRMTEFLAVELSPLDVRVNCISPGAIDTPALRASMGGGDAEPDWGAMTRHSLVARIGQPEDIARAALFLASDEASFVTGQNLAVDGGASTGVRPSDATRVATDENIERWMSTQRTTTAGGSVS